MSYPSLKSNIYIRRLFLLHRAEQFYFNAGPPDSTLAQLNYFNSRSNCIFFKYNLHVIIFFQDELVQRYLMQAHIWDPTKEKLKPRPKNPDLSPIWKFKAEYGIPPQKIM